MTATEFNMNDEYNHSTTLFQLQYACSKTKGTFSAHYNQDTQLL